jgi:predicted enzyme related to lactoylglutathione lyase
MANEPSSFSVLRVSPMIPSFDLKKTIGFFTAVFSFTVLLDTGAYAVLMKDDVTLHVIRAGDIGEMSYYLEVDSVDEVWEQIKDHVGGIQVKPPFDRDYGMRELHIIVPETKTLMLVGQAI